MSAKLIFQAVLGIIAGIAFIAVGFYFLSSRFLGKLNEASPVQSDEAFRKNEMRAKGSGYITLALGALTLVHSLMILTFPQVSNWLSLAYLVLVMISVLVLVFVFK